MLMTFLTAFVATLGVVAALIIAAFLVVAVVGVLIVLTGA